jgi:hypothetical protein
MLPDTVARLLKGEPVPPCSQSLVLASDFDEDWVWYRPLGRRQASREDLIGFLYRGCAGEYLGEPNGRVPSLTRTLQLLLDHYVVSELLVREVGRALEAAIPESLTLPDRKRLLGILNRGWAQLREMCDESAGKESVCPETAAA